MPKRPAIRWGLPRLGDLVEGALSSVGITKERVAEWLGACGCVERRDKLNDLSDWAYATMGLTVPEQEQSLEELLSKERSDGQATAPKE